MKFNNKTLKKAAQDWLINKNFALKEYGHISKWDTSKVTNMSKLFYINPRSPYWFQNPDFNEDLSNWDVSNVKNMSMMFLHAASFNKDINNWDVSNVENMNHMFNGAKSFNQPIGNWDVSNVKNMSMMFSYAESFNNDISNWDVSNVENMDHMFDHASSFNQSIGKWDVSKVINMYCMFWGPNLFNQPIGNWNTSNVTNMSAMFGTENNMFNQPIGKWNVSKVVDMSGMFWGASNFNQSLEQWDVSSVKDMSRMFNGAKSFNQPLKNWDVSSVKDMSSMFDGATSFNLDNQPHKISDPLTQSKPVEVNEIESNIDGKIWIAMEKSEFIDIDDNTFEALGLTIQFSDEGDGEHEVTETIKNELNFENLVFTEYQDDSGEFKLQKVINCPEIQDTDNYGDAGHHGPFSTTGEVIDYLKKLKTINFDELDLYIDSTD